MFYLEEKNQTMS